MIKYKKLSILILTDKEEIYPVSLTKSEMDIIAEVLTHLHNGKIKVFEEEIHGIKFIENDKNHNNRRNSKQKE